MKAPTEASVLRACLDLLTVRKVMHWRANQIPVPLKGGGYRKFTGLRGVSDILCVLPGGRLLAIEVKSATGRLRKEQQHFLNRVNSLGGIGIVVRDVRELDMVLQSVGVA